MSLDQMRDPNALKNHNICPKLMKLSISNFKFALQPEFYAAPSTIFVNFD